jgi:hypothetical protein
MHYKQANHTCHNNKLIFKVLLMRPTLQYIKNNKLFKQTPIVHDKGKSFKNKKELIAFINSIKLRSINTDVLLHIKCACNQGFIFSTINEIPEKNVVCDCGQKVIVYTDEK